MTGDWQDDEGPPEEDDGLPVRRSDRGSRRRGPTRSQVVRRRLTAAAAIAVVAVALIIVVTSTGGESDDKGTGDAAAKATKKAPAKAKPESHEVTNATPQADWKPYAGPVPILEYHVLGAPPEGAPYPELYVGRTDFEKQMDWLEGRGYEAVTLEQVQEAWYHDGKLPPKPIVISFDDGYRPQYTFALPTLRRHGWAGVLNLKAEGSELYESNVKAMIAAGWELAAHTIHHLDLTELGPEELEEEVAGSRKILQKEFKVPVDNFCYPAGRFDDTVIEAVEAAG
ncbi:MAG TPA: polysaccharide deacetylase family protein, partial [Solirubrobacterales bacterium]|nr:polysaccharide deacetylase family protein [Solirubrobacterales bacterium]